MCVVCGLRDRQIHSRTSRIQYYYPYNLSVIIKYLKLTAMDFSRPRKRSESLCPPPPRSSPEQGIHQGSFPVKYSSISSPAALLPQHGSAINAWSFGKDTIPTRPVETAIRRRIETQGDGEKFCKREQSFGYSSATRNQANYSSPPCSPCSISTAAFSDEIAYSPRELDQRQRLLGTAQDQLDLQYTHRTGRTQGPLEVALIDHRIPRKPVSRPQSPIGAERCSSNVRQGQFRHELSPSSVSATLSLFPNIHGSDSSRSNLCHRARQTSLANPISPQPPSSLEQSGFYPSDDECESKWYFGKRSTRSNSSEETGKSKRGRHPRRSLSEAFRALGHAIKCGS